MVYKLTSKVDSNQRIIQRKMFAKEKTIMEEDRVRFICKRTVVSTRSIEPGRLYQLSVLDHVMEPNHIRLVYYYRCSKTREPGEITKKLRESLAYTLNCYPIVTGRLVKEVDGMEENKDLSQRWMVKSNDAGVRIVNREEELKLVHWEDMYHLQYYWSTFCVQVYSIRFILVWFSTVWFCLTFSCLFLSTGN